MVNTSDILPNTPRYLKVPLIFFNAILWILGVILVALGGYSLKQLQQVQSLISITVPAGIIVLGVFIVVLTIVGCVVAYKEKLIGLIFYTVVMLILLVALIGVGGGAFTYREEVPAALQKSWYGAEPLNPNILGLLQYQFSCCGWDTGNTSQMANATSGPGKDLCVTTNPNANITGPCGGNFTHRTSNPDPLGYVQGNFSICQNLDDPQVNITAGPYDQPYVGENITLPDHGDDRFDCIADPALLVAIYECWGTGTVSTYNPKNLPGCSQTITPFVEDRLYVAAVAGIVVGVIEFVCMLFSLFLIIRLCRSPRARSYD